jgi:hypothetical protein
MIILRLEERYIYNGTWSNRPRQYRPRINQIRPHTFRRLSGGNYLCPCNNTFLLLIKHFFVKYRCTVCVIIN